MRQWEREVNSTTAETAGMRPRLARTLTLSHAVLYGLGVTIGRGGARQRRRRAGMHAPLAFLGAAAIMGLSAASFAELGTRMPAGASEGCLNPHTGTPIVATLIGATAILMFAIFVPLEGLAKLTSQCTLGLFTLVNLALIRIKMTGTIALPPCVFICPFWVAVAGVIASAALLVIDVALIG